MTDREERQKGDTQMCETVRRGETDGRQNGDTDLSTDGRRGDVRRRRGETEKRKEENKGESMICEMGGY